MRLIEGNGSLMVIKDKGLSHLPGERSFVGTRSVIFLY